MKLLFINGSPRKEWNTSILLHESMKGAESAGAETEIINLYDLDFKGCRSCMACNLRDEKFFGHCSYNDELQTILEKIDKCDGLILGSPIYFGDVTAEMRAFLERLIFQYANFDDGSSLYNGDAKVGFIYTMNASEGYFNSLYDKYASLLGMHFEYAGTVESAETLQVKDYGKYHLGFFDEKQRQERRKEVFPKDCENAYELGKSLVN
jgi:multimeric flavodoxin WrbA